jgi:ankyrin repeat protein
LDLILKLLEDDEIPINSLDIYSWSPLHYAVFAGQIRVALLLLRHPKVVSFLADGGKIKIEPLEES